MKKTIVQDSSKHNAIHHLGLPGSSIDGEASKVVLYQKYSVSDDIVHSVTLGHTDHGNVGYNKQIFFLISHFSLH